MTPYSSSPLLTPQSWSSHNSSVQKMSLPLLLNHHPHPANAWWHFVGKQKLQLQSSYCYCTFPKTSCYIRYFFSQKQSIWEHCELGPRILNDWHTKKYTEKWWIWHNYTLFNRMIFSWQDTLSDNCGKKTRHTRIMDRGFTVYQQEATYSSSSGTWYCGWEQLDCDS
jgi:hypothetical protein